MKFVRLLAVALTALSVPALADPAPLGDFQITNVILESGNPFVMTQGNGNPGGCDQATFLALPSDPALRSEYLSIAETAISTGLKVSMWVNGCSPSSWGSAPAIYHMNLHR